jgi:adenosine deaminase
VLDAVRDASRRSGLGIAVVIAANRTRHPMDARTLARLAAQYAGRGVVGFGLSNDERRGTTTGSRPRSRSPSGPG